MFFLSFPSVLFQWREKNLFWVRCFFFKTIITGLRAVYGRLLCLSHWNVCLCFLRLECHIIMVAEKSTEDITLQKLFMWWKDTITNLLLSVNLIVQLWKTINKSIASKNSLSACLPVNSLLCQKKDPHKW